MFFHKFLPQIKTTTCSLYVVSMRFLCCFYVGQKFTYKITFSKIYLVPSKLLIYIKFRQKVNLLVSETQGAVQTVTDGTVGESPRSGSTRRRASGSEPQGEPQDDFQNASAGAEQSEQSPPAQTSAAQSSPSSSGSWNDDSWGQWNDWYGHSWHQWEDEDEEGDEQPWEDEDHMMPVVLPEEVLGWLLMRKSGLSSQAKLAIQAASGNSLKFTDVERAMRLQEEELLHPERARPPHGRHQPRSYWVDTGENWGLYMSPPDELDVHDEDHEIHWLDNESFAAALFPPESVTPQGVCGTIKMMARGTQMVTMTGCGTTTNGMRQFLINGFHMLR